MSIDISTAVIAHQKGEDVVGGRGSRFATS